MSQRKNRRVLEAALVLVIIAVMLLALMVTIDGSAPIVVAIPL